MSRAHLIARWLAATLGVTGSLAIVAAASQNDDVSWGLAFLGFLVMGTLVLWQQPSNRIGWIMWTIGLLIASDMSVQWFASTSHGPGPVLLEVLALPLTIIVFALVVILVAVFPDGTPAGPWERRLVIGVSIVVIPVVLVTLVSPRALTSGRTSPIALSGAEPWVQLVVDDSFLIVPVALGLAATSLALRWRHSRGRQRAQFKWLTLGATITVVVLLTTFMIPSSIPVTSAVVLGMAALPVCIGIAISRYHLYDIDRVVSRTASYTVVTAVVLTVYAAVVTTVTRLVPSSNTLAVAGATLAAAALVRPLLRRVQGGIDRRFNRSRYDAQRTVDAFGQRLSHDADAETVSQDLVAVVSQALEPHDVALWVRSDA